MNCPWDQRHAVHIKDPQRHLKLSPKTWLTFFYILPELSINSLFEKSQIERSTCYKISYSKSWKVNHVFFSCAIRLPSVWKLCTVKKNKKMNKYLSRCLSYSQVWYINHGFSVNDICLPIFEIFALQGMPKWTSTCQ